MSRGWSGFGCPEPHRAGLGRLDEARMAEGRTCKSRHRLLGTESRFERRYALQRSSHRAYPTAIKGRLGQTDRETSVGSWLVSLIAEVARFGEFSDVMFGIFASGVITVAWSRFMGRRR